MIHSFSCKNFYSFRELTTLSFVVNDNAPQTHGYFNTSFYTRLSKVETVIGPNASGKTNLLKVLPFLKWMIIDSFNLKPDANLPVQSFAFGGEKNSPIELSVVFEINKKIYTYSFVLAKGKVLSEDLKLTSMAKEKKSSKKIFSRNWDDSTQQYNFEADNFDLPKGFEKSLRSNASVIGTAVRLNHQESQEVTKFWQQIETNVSEAGWIGDHLFPNTTLLLIEALHFYSANETLKKEAEKLLSRFDLGLDAFEIEKQQKENELSFNVRVAHTFNQQKQYLPLQYESSGTKQLLLILKTILQVLAKGGVTVLDEFDVNLHPDVVRSLFDLFLHPETNPHNAQLLFSTHSHMILSKLDKYQIVLVEKNENGISESWRLDEVAGVRVDDNYYSKYIAGAYGAIPKIY